MSKKENRFIMHYDYESRKRVFRLNGRDVTVEIERLLEAHEKEIVSTKCKLFQLDMTIQQRLQNQIEELKQQLFESGLKTLEEIKLSEQRKEMLEDLSTKNWKLEQQLAQVNQDKISFAITQLEKIKDKFREIYDKNRKHHLSVVKCYELVDEQITELSNENERNGE